MVILPQLILALVLSSGLVQVRSDIPSIHKRSIDAWIQANPGNRVASESDCGACQEQIQAIRKGMGGTWKPVPNYQPYYLVGDFNSDGKKDFAIVVFTSASQTKRFRVLVFNGPFSSSTATTPAFISELMDLTGQGLFFGPPRPKPYRLLVGGFESEGVLLLPEHNSYVWGR